MHDSMRQTNCNKKLRDIPQMLLFAALSLAVCALPSCHSSKGSTAQQVETRPQTRPEDKKHKPDTPAATSKMGKALVAAARKWIGTPYAYGGHSRKGTDCSGFLMEVFRECAGIDLPRSSRDQQAYCHPIDREDLAIGDLVFFSSKRSGSRVSHVGMYIGNGRMIHASSSRGVVEDDLSLQYYVTHFRGAGRVPLLAAASPLPEKAAQTTEPAQTAKPVQASAPTQSGKDGTGTRASAPKPEATSRVQTAITPDTAQAQTRPGSIVRDAFSKTKKNKD